MTVWVPRTGRPAPAAEPGRAAPPSASWTAVVAVAGAAAGLLAAVDPLWGLAAAVLVAAAAVAVARPELVTLAVVAVLYSNAAVIAVRMHGVPAVLGQAVVLLLAVPLAHRLLVLRQPLVLPPALGVLVLFGAVQALSALRALDLPAAAATTTEFAVEGLLLFTLVVNTVTGSTALKHAVWVLLAVGSAMGLLSVWQQVTGTFGNDYWGFAQVSEAVVRQVDGSLTRESPRLAGPIGETNRYAQVLLVLLPLGLALAVGARRRTERLAALAATLCVGAGVVLTYSRGAMVALVVVLLVAAGLRVVRLRHLLLVVGVLAVVLAAVPAYRDRLVSLGAVTSAADPFAPGRADGALVGRASENIAALLAMRDHLLTGVGPGGFPSVYQHYVRTLGLLPHEGPREAHNLYAGLGAELGIVGLVVFLALMVLVLKDLLRARRAWRYLDPERSVLAAGFILAVVAYLASGTFLHLSYQRYLWLTLALAVSASALPGRRPGPADGRSG